MMLLIVLMGEEVGDEAQEACMLSSDLADAEVERRKEVRMWENEVVSEGKIGFRMVAFRDVLCWLSTKILFIE
jgi:hypothetical protein